MTVASMVEKMAVLKVAQTVAQMVASLDPLMELRVQRSVAKWAEEMAIWTAV